MYDQACLMHSTVASGHLILADGNKYGFMEQPGDDHRALLPAAFQQRVD
jgi:hypothetical protein